MDPFRLHRLELVTVFATEYLFGVLVFKRLTTL